MQTTRYTHHGREVVANAELKGRHREICLCYECGNFKPGEPDNCAAAQQLYQLVVAGPICVAPVLECDNFVEKQ